MQKPFLRYVIEERAAQRGDANFLTFGDRQFSYREMDENANRVANILLDLGVRPNDHAAIFLPNCPEFIFFWFASIKLNITLIPINIHLKGDALRYIVEHSAPRVLITSAALWRELEVLPDALPENCRVLILGYLSLQAPHPNEFFSYSKMLEHAPNTRPPDTKIAEDDTALIMYTSGTTGHSKGVMIGRRAQSNHPHYYHAELIKTAPQETAYTYLPLFHITSMGVTMGSFVGGARLALDTEFNPFGFWDRVRKHDAKIFPYLGAVIAMLWSRPAREDDADNPVTHALGAAAPKEIWETFERRFGLQLLETYGQTEWKAIWTSHPPGQTRIGSAGKAPARAQVRIIDENDKPLPPGEPGQIIMRPNEPGLMMSGYYKQPELNAKVFKDGWYYTGDMGALDEDGYLYFKGRLKDYIRRRGENISAFEIENVVNTHPAIVDSAAVGVPSEITEEEVMLCVVLKPEQNLVAPELYRWCVEKLPKFMVPRYIKILPELPRTPTQRVRKFMLAESGTTGAWDRKAQRNKSQRES
jgi:carnitine-CoA ligase